MKTRLLIAFVALGASWASAHDSDKDHDLGHWYLEGAFSRVDLKESESSIESQTATCGNLLNVLPGPLGCANSASNVLVLFPNSGGPGMPQSFSMDYDESDGFDVSLGYDFPGAPRFELNYVQYRNDVNKIDGMSTDNPDTLESKKLLGNVWFDFNEDGVFQPYIGFGLGATELEFAESDDTVLTANAGVGVNFALGSHVKINVGYRYFEGKDPVFKDDNSTLETEYSGQRLLFGLRYDFLNDPPVPPDADGDGVEDKIDRCPQTPREAQVDPLGCPLDGDRDGVADYLDQCPDTKPGVQVDERGCDLDSDGDGVTNALDKCPQTPPGKRVLNNGCQSVVLQGVTFLSGSAELTSTARQVCREVAGVLNTPDAADINVELQGHTDSQGADTYNLRLSQERAEALRSCLIENGVAASRLSAKGYGEYKPVASNMTADGRARNRRTEMKIINQ